jgi:carboxypeptidase family protein/TonB-dependent receptor-like protein
MSQRSRIRFSLPILFSICLILYPVSALSQTLASVSAIVQDTTGAVIQHAKLTVASSETGFQRQAETNDNGLAQVLGIPPGEYKLTAEAAGFKPVTQLMRLTVGQNASANLVLSIQVTTEVTVSDVAETLNTYKAQVSEVIDQHEIQNLPIKGRNFIDFVMLTPEVTLGNSTSVGSQAPFTEQTPKLSFGGVRETHSVFISLDGVDYTTSLSGLQRSSPAQDWVQEFRAVSNTYESEVGRTLGGIVNSVTRSGSNTLHGGAYEYFRNNQLDAVNPLSVGGSDALRLNQFGLTLGGPIVTDKTFYFTGYEGQRRAQSPRFTSFIRDAIGGINATKQFFGLSPENLNSVLIINDYDKFIGKVDHQFNTSTTLSTRYLFSDERNSGTPGAPPGIGLPSAYRSNPIRDQSLAANLIHTVSNSMTSDTVFQFARRTFHLDPVGAGREPFIAIPNLVQGGGPVGSFTFYRETRLQMGENLAYIHGSHTFKMGVEFNNLWNSTKSSMFTPGVAVFSPDSFFAPQPFAVVFYFGMPRSLWGTQLIPRGTDWQASLLPPPMFKEFDDASSAQFTRQIYGAYFQDQWRPTPRFSVTMGLRYDNERRMFQERNWYAPDNNNFQPRVGFAWQITPATVLRGGFGIYTGPFNWSELIGTSTAFGPITGYLNNPLVSDFVNPSNTLVGLAAFGPVGVQFPHFDPVLNQVVFPAASAFANFAATGAYPAPDQLIGFSHGFTTKNFPNPYAENGSLQLERSIGKDIQISAGYNFIHGLKIHYFGDANAAPAGTLPNGKQALTLSDPNFGFAFLDSPEAYSIYHGGFLTFNRRFRNNFQLMANYTWSRSIDNQTTIGYPTGPQNYLRKDLERAVSDNHIAHRLVLFGVVESPYQNILLKSWDLGVTTVVQSPRFQSVQVGFDTNGDGFPFSDRVGLLGRNTYQGGNFRNVDLRLERAIPFKLSQKEARATFSLEVFNLFNRKNVIDVNNIYGAGDLIGAEPRRFGDGVQGPIPVLQFGTPRSIADMRQLQLSARISF